MIRKQWSHQIEDMPENFVRYHNLQLEIVCDLGVLCKVGCVITDDRLSYAYDPQEIIEEAKRSLIQKASEYLGVGIPR